MKRIYILLFLMICVKIHVDAQNVPDNIFGKKLPYTWEMPMPNGKMISTMHRNGMITSQMVTGCFICSGLGTCGVCKGTGGQYWYGIGIMPCGNCGGTGRCPACKGKGYSVISSTTSPSGLTVAYDENGNCYVAGGTGASSGSRSSGSSSASRSAKTCGLCGGKGWVAETKGVPDFGLSDKWCDGCNKRVPANHYHTTCPSCKGKGKW